MTAYLEGKAEELGLDFRDHGAVVVIGLGESADKLGPVTHADVQPADPSEWVKDRAAPSTVVGSASCRIGGELTAGGQV